MRINKTVFDILLVEDDLGDAGLVKIAIRKGEWQINPYHVKNGDEALAFLRRIGPDLADAPRPDLILLDLNLPGRSGHEILKEIKSDTNLHQIPVVVLSTSDAERDVVRAYEFGANSYVTKPMDVEDFIRAIHGIEEYWFGVAQLPE